MSIPKTLGGLILYHNKIIHTQLSIKTSKMIVFSDPYRIKSSAELISDAPQGVKLLQVYIPRNEYQEYFKNCIGDELENEASISSSSLKRDTSLLFTSVPEDSTFSPPKEPLKKPQKKSRPNSLNLKDCAGDNGKRQTPVTPYWGHNSAVSTPMSEIKPFVNPAEAKTSKDPIWKLSLDFHSIQFKNNCAKNQDCVLENTICFPKPLEIYSRRLEKAERLGIFVQSTLEKSSMHHYSSLQDFHYNSISLNQYFTKSKTGITLRRRNSIHDPLYPWFRKNIVGASQYYVEEVLNKHLEVNRREESSFKELITERKKSLMLPIKPHNASEPQKGDMKSPGGYCTPLMNKLSMRNLSDVQSSSKEIPTTSFVTQKDNAKTQSENSKPKSNEMEKCTLFMYGENDMVLSMLLTEDCSRNKRTVEKLHSLCTEHLPNLETQIRTSIDLFKLTPSHSEPYSMMAMDSEWGSLKQSGPWSVTDLNDLTRLHGDFTEDEDIKEIYLRKPEAVLFGHRDGPTQVFYQETTPSSSGLLSPNDPLGTVHQTAKKRLEKNHNIIIK